MEQKLTPEAAKYVGRMLWLKAGPLTTEQMDAKLDEFRAAGIDEDGIKDIRTGYNAQSAWRRWHDRQGDYSSHRMFELA